MGVYHLSGLGVNLGALTVPISTVYILQMAQHCGVKVAENFFAASGEAERKGSQEGIRGQVECVIAFTSKEVAEGDALRECESKWFNLKFEKGTPLDEVCSKFFDKLFGHMKKEFRFEPRKFEFLVIQVDHRNFEDCFRKIGPTLKALVDKELWANMIGGTNQINMAILTAGAYVASVSKYYYLFQENQKLLEPEWADKPTKNNIGNLALKAIESWYEIPIFNLDLGDLMTELKKTFEGKEKINIGELRSILDGLNLGKEYIPKLRGILLFENETVRKGPFFERLLKLWEELDSIRIKNYSEWKKWAKNEGVLKEVKIF
jgi:hypothetical protein